MLRSGGHNTRMGTIDTSAILLPGGLLALLLAMAWTYNRLVRSAERTKEAWSGIEVQLGRRASLIPALVEAVRGYARHERATLAEVAEARTALQTSTGARDAGSANSRLTGAIDRLLVLAEAYPELEASRSFLALQEELADVEEKIAFARQFYNRNALEFNTAIRSIPGVLVAFPMRLRRFDFFEAGEEMREAVPVRLAEADGAAGR